MKTDLIDSLTSNFEAHAQTTDSGIEFWLARDQHVHRISLRVYVAVRVRKQLLTS
jgi:hypothetical protein